MRVRVRLWVCRVGVCGQSMPQVLSAVCCGVRGTRSIITAQRVLSSNMGLFGCACVSALCSACGWVSSHAWKWFGVAGFWVDACVPACVPACLPACLPACGEHTTTPETLGRLAPALALALGSSLCGIWIIRASRYCLGYTSPIDLETGTFGT